MKRAEKILFAGWLVLLISEIWKQWALRAVLAYPPEKAVWFFPFQLCSTPMYACLLLPFSAGKHREGFRSALLTYLASFGLLAGIMAFCDTSGFRETGFLPLTLHSYCWHILLILQALPAVSCLHRENSWNFSGAAGLYLAGCMTAELINAALSGRGIINMFYINPGLPMAQVCFSEIAAYAGNTAGILVYIFSTLLGALLLYTVLLAGSGIRQTAGPKPVSPSERSL